MFFHKRQEHVDFHENDAKSRFPWRLGKNIATLRSQITVLTLDCCAKTIHFVRKRMILGFHFETVFAAEWFNLGGHFASKLSSKIAVLHADSCAKTVHFV